MCMTSPSESGHGGRFEPCEAYIKLLSEKSRLEGRCAGLELGNKINLESIKRQDERIVELLKENEKLRSELSTTRKALVETELTLGTLNYRAQLLIKGLLGEE